MSRALLLASLCLSAQASFAHLTGTVIHVSDGDTLVVLDHTGRQHRVRLAGIDAPERGQPYSQRAREALIACAHGQSVRLKGEKTDRYHRRVAKVLNQRGEDCNLRQVRLGFAWHYKHYASEQSEEDARAYAEAEDAARLARLGLWHEDDPAAPWSHRTARRAGSAEPDGLNTLR